MPKARRKRAKRSAEVVQQKTHPKSTYRENRKSSSTDDDNDIQTSMVVSVAQVHEIPSKITDPTGKTKFVDGKMNQSVHGDFSSCDGGGTSATPVKEKVRSMSASTQSSPEIQNYADTSSHSILPVCTDHQNTPINDSQNSSNRSGSLLFPTRNNHLITCRELSVTPEIVNEQMLLSSAAQPCKDVLPIPIVIQASQANEPGGLLQEENMIIPFDEDYAALGFHSESILAPNDNVTAENEVSISVPTDLTAFDPNSESILTSTRLITPENEISIPISDLLISGNNSLQFLDNRVSHIFSAVEDLESGNMLAVSQAPQQQSTNSRIDSSAQTQNSTTSFVPSIMDHDHDYISVPNTSVSTEEENQSYQGRPSRGRKRKHAGQNRSQKKAKLNKGQQYVNSKGVTVEKKKFAGKGFNCKCKKKCTEKITEHQRKIIFKNYWMAGSFEARCALLQSYCKEIPKKKHCTGSNPSKRKFSRQYVLNDVPVCLKTFLNTLSISSKPLEIAMKRKRNDQSVNDKRGTLSGGRNKVTAPRLEQIRDFIKKLPKYKSHYCRENNNAKFLAPNLNLSKVYELYKKQYTGGVSKSCFKKFFYTEFNLRFKKPQKDTCNRCDVFKARMKNLQGRELDNLTEEHNRHLDQAKARRQKMKDDLKLAKEDSSTETLTFDLEKTNCLPRLPTNIIYYKRQPNLYNFGIHEGSTNKGYFNVWLEHEGGRGTQEVGGCLKKFMAENLKTTTKHLILWADSCGGQNKSIKLVLLLMHALLNSTHLETITLRYLQPGHTYLPNDSEFGDLECALKAQTRLYTADDFIQVMETCRHRNKFTIDRMRKDDMLSVEPLLKAITNRKVDENKQKISWLNTAEIKMKKEVPLKLFFKTDLSSPETQIVDIRKKTKQARGTPDFKDFELELLWPSGKELSSAKVKDLKEIVKLKLIPEDAEGFYNFLNDVGTSNFEDDVDGFGENIDFEIISNES